MKGRTKHWQGARLLSMLCAAVCVWYLAAPAGLSAGLNTFLQGYRAEEGKIEVYCSNLEAAAGQEIKPELFTASVSGQPVEITDITTVGEQKEGITFYCLVDVSGSMNNEQMAQAKDVLYAVCDGLEGDDNMVVGELGTTLEVSEFLTDKEEIRGRIDALVADEDYTALYDAVIDSISALQSNKSCNPKKCLILISDGDNKTVIGKTRQEALDAVEDSRIPMYTVAALRNSHTRQQIEYAENLGAFARQSAGGKDYVPRVDGIEASGAGEDILQDTRGGQILIIDAAGVKAEREEVLLSIGFDAGEDVYTDTLYLYAADLPAATEEPSSEPEEPEGSEESKEGEDTPPESSGPEESEDLEESEEAPSEEEAEPESLEEFISENLILICAVGAGALLLIIVIVAVIVSSRKKKKKRALAEAEAARAAEEAAQAEAEAEAARAAQEAAQREAAMAAESVPEEPKAQEVPPAGPCYEVKFVAVGYENIVFVLHIPEDKTLTVGRNAKADLVLNSEDRKLSSVHFRARCMQGVMNVWDADSQNGTFVNGVPIKQIGMATVQNNDLLRVGGYEYRIFIRKERS